jgi:hypothetical protein
MNTKQYLSDTEEAKIGPSINLRLRKATYEKMKALSKREHRAISAQCAVFVERQLALAESDESRA